MVLHLVGSDHAAHKERGVRGLYRRKLAAYDRLIPELRRLMGPGAAVLVVADHACNGSGSHGAGEPEATRAPYVLAGPGVLSLGRRDLDQRALAPTVAALMGVDVPWTAQVPGLLDALDLSEAQRSGLALNHAAARAAHLCAELGHKDKGVSALVARAARARAEGSHRRSRRLSTEAISRVAALGLAHSRSSRWLWLAALSLLLSVPALLLVAPATLGQGGARAWGALGFSLVASALGVVLVFTVSPRVSTVLGALLLACALVGWLVAWRRMGALRWLPLALASFALASLGAWALDWTRRLWQGDPSGRLWLAFPGLAAVLGGMGWAWVTGRLRRGLVQHPGLLAGLATAVLFLPLPFLRWWGGRHLVVGLAGVAAAAGLAAWARARGLLTWRVLAGFAALAGSLGLGLAFGFGRGPEPDARVGVAVAMGAPVALLVLGGLSRRALLSATTLVTTLAWVAAQLPRLGLLSPYLALVLSAVALLVVLVLGRGSGAHLALLSLATLRVLAPDQVVAATTLFGAGVLGMARLRYRPGGVGTAILAVLMVLAELVVFYQLGREFAFGTIDVRMGFVGGGEIDLVRITLLILLANATPWWLLFAAALDLSLAGGRGARAWLDSLLRLQLWILAVKVLGTFLLFAGRPTHFWLIHSLIPFQFFGLANLIMIVAGYGLARSMLRASAGRDPGGVRRLESFRGVSGSTRKLAAPAR